MKQHARGGFSLIELITVVTITAIISVVGANVLVTSQLRGARTNTVSSIRQEGQVALDQITYFLRNARYVEPNQFGQTCQAAMTSFRVRLRDDTVVEFYESESGRVASNSGAIITAQPAAYLTSPALRLDDSLTFSCSQAPDETGALVEVRFTVSAGDETSPQEARFSQEFVETVYIRSYQ